MTKDKITYIHIPRTGGGSFIQLLNDWYSPDFYKYPGTNYAPRKRKAKHIAGHFQFHIRFKETFLCTFVRDPIEWTISLWHYYNMLTQTRPNRKHFKTPIDLMNWKDKSNKITKKNHNVQSAYLGLSTPEDFDFIGITDQYEDSIKLFQRIAPLSKIRVWNNHRINAAPRNNIEIKQEWIEQIKERNQQDIELYERAKERFNQLN